MSFFIVRLLVRRHRGSHIRTRISRKGSNFETPLPSNFVPVPVPYRYPMCGNTHSRRNGALTDLLLPTDTIMPSGTGTGTGTGGS